MLGKRVHAQAQKPDFRVAIAKHVVPSWESLRVLHNQSPDVPVKVMYIDGDANLLFEMDAPAAVLPCL